MARSICARRAEQQQEPGGEYLTAADEGHPGGPGA